jgi:phosphoglycerate dehydrogenase-like enzyme
MGMKQIAYDIVEGDRGGMERAKDLVDLARRSDAVTVHMPATSATNGCINADVFAVLHQW